MKTFKLIITKENNGQTTQTVREDISEEMIPDLSLND